MTVVHDGDTPTVSPRRATASSGSPRETRPGDGERLPGQVTHRLGFRLAVSTSLLTLLTFGLALTAIPNSGRNCTVDCATYPFTGDIVARQFPGDYLWMFPAMLLMLVFVALTACIHAYAPEERKIYGTIGLGVAVLAAGVLLIDYFVQVTVMQPSLEKGQLEGLALLTQYNPNGLFLALEELGFLLMSTVFGVTAAVFVGPGRVERSIRRLFTLSFVATVGAFVIVSVLHGFDRQDTFEIAVISLVWLTLIAAGPLLAMMFRQAMVGGADPEAPR